MSSGDNIALSIAGVGNWSAMLPTRLNELPKRSQTEIIELCIARALEWWIATYLPMRFKMGYATSQLGYRIYTKNYNHQDANVKTGATREMVMQTAHVETVATGGRLSGTISAKIVMRTPQYINRQAYQTTNKCLRQITPYEGGRIAKMFFYEVVSANGRLVPSTVRTRSGTFQPRQSLGYFDASQVGRTNRATIIQQRRSLAQAARNA